MSKSTAPPIAILHIPCGRAHANSSIEEFELLVLPWLVVAIRFRQRDEHICIDQPGHSTAKIRHVNPLESQVRYAPIASILQALRSGRSRFAVHTWLQPLQSPVPKSRSTYSHEYYNSVLGISDAKERPKALTSSTSERCFG